MSEEARQKWIGIAMDLLVEYYAVCETVTDPDLFPRKMCERIADAVGGGATSEFVWELLQRRLHDERMR